MNLKNALNNINKNLELFVGKMNVKETPNTALSMVSNNNYPNLILKPLLGFILAASMSLAAASPSAAGLHQEGKVVSDFVSESVADFVNKAEPLSNYSSNIENNESASFEEYQHPINKDKSIFVYTHKNDKDFNYLEDKTFEKYAIQRAKSSNFRTDEFSELFEVEGRSQAFSEQNFIVVNGVQADEMEKDLNEMSPNGSVLGKYSQELIFYHEIGHVAIDDTESVGHEYEEDKLESETTSDVFALLMISKTHNLNNDETIKMIDELSSLRVDDNNNTHASVIGLSVLKNVINSGLEIDKLDTEEIFRLSSNVSDTSNFGMLLKNDLEESGVILAPSSLDNLKAQITRGRLYSSKVLEDGSRDFEKLSFRVTSLNSFENVIMNKYSKTELNLDNDEFFNKYEDSISNEYKFSSNKYNEALSMQYVLKEAMVNPEKFSSLLETVENSDVFKDKVSDSISMSKEMQSVSENNIGLSNNKLKSF